MDGTGPQPENVQPRAALRRLRMVILVVVLGLALSLASFLFVMRGRQAAQEAELTRVGGNIAAVLQTSFNVHLASLLGVVSFLDTAGEVSRAEFRRFVAPGLARHPGLQAVEWAPRVVHADRAAFEARVRAEGFPGFRLTERAPDGRQVEIGPRDEYYPILYVEPFAENAEAFGYADMGTSRSAVIAAARDSGQPAASARLELIQEEEQHFGLIIFLPVFEDGVIPDSVPERRRRLRGFVEGVFQIDSLFRSELGGLSLPGTSWVLFDDADPMDLRPLYVSDPQFGLPAPWLMSQEQGIEMRERLDRERHVHHAVELAGRRFDLRTIATESFSFPGPELAPLLILAVGLVLTLLLAAYLSLHMSRTERVEELVRARTAELQASEAQLRQAQKLESVGRLAGGIAHDFNNLLTAIVGGVQMASLDLPPDSPAAEELRLVRKASDRAAALVKQLLAFSRRQVLNPAPLDLNAIVRDMQAMLQRLIGEDVTLDLELQEGLGRVHADRGQMEQVVLNLVVNARDAMPSGGRLIIATADTASAPDGGGGPRVRLSVQDTGAGMNEQIRARIFEPFFTTKEPGRGTGLGLSTVYGIVTQSGGTVAVASRPGAGARFDILLPRHAAPAAAPDTTPVETPTSTTAGAPAVPPSGPPAEHPAGQATGQAAGVPAGTSATARDGGDGCILVVEDDDDVRAAVTKVLAAAGYEVLEAADGETALRLQAEHRARVQLVLTDLIMPGLTGGQLARELAVRAPGLRLLLMTGYADDRAAAAVAGLDNCGTLQKPFAREELLAAVGTALADA